MAKSSNPKQPFFDNYGGRGRRFPGRAHFVYPDGSVRPYAGPAESELREEEKPEPRAVVIRQPEE